MEREYRRRLKKAFDAEGIEIPFPHQSLNMGSASTPFRVEVIAPSPGAWVGRGRSGRRLAEFALTERPSDRFSILKGQQVDPTGVTTENCLNRGGHPTSLC
ncbi:MAG: hypothetical protein ACOYXU_06785 [Nitrospirota bacterium]